MGSEATSSFVYWHQFRSGISQRGHFRRLRYRKISIAGGEGSSTAAERVLSVREALGPTPSSSIREKSEHPLQSV